MVNTFWEATRTGKLYVQPESTDSSKSKNEKDSLKKKVSETSLERMTGTVGLSSIDDVHTKKAQNENTNY